MIKFVLGLIALVFVGLALYVYADKENKPPREQQAVHKTAKQESPSQRKLSVTEPKTVHKIEDVVKHVVKKENRKVETTSSEVDLSELATTDNIEYLPNENRTSNEPLSSKEWDAIEKQMIANGQISTETDMSASTENLGYDPSEMAVGN